ncbi:MAG: type II toxin-antitoxin system HicB family antitoxin [Armatimonadetes bacterium]|nr:type II toxin-antitoxin system HicB family antitoxin [Armatimonadota bacterium]
MRKSLEYYLSLDYPVEIRRIEENLGGGYVASIPTLGSRAFVGDGETPQEAYENLQAAKKEIFAEYLAEGVAIPEPAAEQDYEHYSGRLVVRMPRALHANLVRVAKQNDTSLNQLIVHALSSYEAKVDTVQEIEQICGMLGIGQQTQRETQLTAVPSCSGATGASSASIPVRILHIASPKPAPGPVLNASQATELIFFGELERRTSWT